MKVGIIANKSYSEQIAPFFKKFLEWLNENDVDFCVEAEFAELAGYPYGISILTMLSKVELLIILGGDGTILRAARLMGKHQIPMLGIRFGRLGFLAELSGDTYEEELRDILSGNYRIDERMVLETHVSTYDESYYALNDIVLLRSATSRLLTAEVFVDDEYMNTFRSDGIIVASPTGSTAYSLSAGGPIVTPGMNAFIINPICPHMLSNRPMVVSGNREIHIRFKELSDGCIVSFDGQQDTPVEPDTLINVRRAEHKVFLVRTKNSNFYSVLRNKLNWN